MFRTGDPYLDNLIVNVEDEAMKTPVMLLVFALVTDINNKNKLIEELIAKAPAED